MLCERLFSLLCVRFDEQSFEVSLGPTIGSPARQRGLLQALGHFLRLRYAVALSDEEPSSLGGLRGARWRVQSLAPAAWLRVARSLGFWAEAVEGGTDPYQALAAAEQLDERWTTTSARAAALGLGPVEPWPTPWAPRLRWLGEGAGAEPRLGGPWLLEPLLPQQVERLRLLLPLAPATAPLVTDQLAALSRACSLPLSVQPLLAPGELGAATALECPLLANQLDAVPDVLLALRAALQALPSAAAGPPLPGLAASDAPSRESPAQPAAAGALVPPPSLERGGAPGGAAPEPLEVTVLPPEAPAPSVSPASSPRFSGGAGAEPLEAELVPLLESLGGPATESPAPLELLGGPATESPAPLEPLGGTATESPAPLEPLGGLAGQPASAVPLERLGGPVEEPAAAPLEPLAGPVVEEPLEFLGGGGPVPSLATEGGGAEAPPRPRAPALAGDAGSLGRGSPRGRMEDLRRARALGLPPPPPWPEALEPGPARRGGEAPSLASPPLADLEPLPADWPSEPSPRAAALPADDPLEEGQAATLRLLGSGPFPSRVQRVLGILFSLDAPTAQRWVRGGERVLLRDAGAEEVRRYAQVLRQAGARCRIEGGATEPGSRRRS